MSQSPTINERKVYEIEGREFATREEAMQYLETRLGSPELVKMHDLLKSLTSRMQNELRCKPLFVKDFDLTESPLIYDLREYNSGELSPLNVTIEIESIDDEGFSVAVTDKYDFRGGDKDGETTSEIVRFTYDELDDFSLLVLFVHSIYESAESDAYEATMTLKHMTENLDTERVIGFFNAQREDED